MDDRTGLRDLFLIVLTLLVCAVGPAVAADDEEWPREIELSFGLVVLYQPQIDRLEGNTLHARAAVSVTPEGTTAPIFGAAWLEARIESDIDARVVTFREVSVPRVRFPESTPEQEQRLIAFLTAEIPRWSIELSLDSLQASLEIAEKQNLAAGGFDDRAPVILFRDEPTVLVTIDGPPQLRELEGSTLQAVVNSPFLIVQDPKTSDVYYLSAGADTWYSAAAVEGAWSVTTKVPKEIRALQPEEEEPEEDDPDAAEEGPSTPPAIVVATVSTELIVTEGSPKYEPIAGGELLVVGNTESDVLREVESQRMFVLLSGRWFAADSLDGPWMFVRSDALPESFAEIDPDSDYGYLLTWVAGTELAEAAVLDAYVPQTAAVKRDATISVTYDGEPEFEPIEETTLHYAVNTESQVIRAESKYYCAEEGVWYVADAPQGPWRVATEIPEEVYSIPPSNPSYNVTYVRIYDSTPEVVYVGYYPGYLGSYHYHGALVYGTGWYYQPWWGPYHYYPRYRTWGFHVRWNPWHGWGAGLSYSTGRFTFGIGFGGYHRRGWWGPGGYHGYRRGYNRGWHRGYRNGSRAGYQAGTRSAKRDSARNLYQSGNNASRVAQTGGGQGSRSPGASTDRANNVYTDKKGNVYRQQSDGNWQKRDGDKWTKSDAGKAKGSSKSSKKQKSKRDSGGSSLNRDSRARQQGSQRSRSYRSGGGGRSRGGGRGGGGRR